MQYQLGNIVFAGAYAPSALGSQHDARYASAPLVNGTTLLQKTGDELTSISLEATLHYSFVNVPRALETFEAARQTGAILPLTDGDGTSYGTYVVQSYAVTRTQASPTGEVLGASVSVSLLQYIDPDPQATATRRARANASGILENGAVAVLVQALPPSDTGAVVLSSLAASGAAAQSSDLVDRAIILPTEQESLLTQAADLYRQGVEELETIAEKVAEGQTLAARAPELLEAAQSAKEVFQNAIGAAQSGDLTNARIQAINATTASTAVGNASQQLYTDLITRRA